MNNYYYKMNIILNIWIVYLIIVKIDFWDTIKDKIEIMIKLK